MSAELAELLERAAERLSLAEERLADSREDFTTVGLLLEAAERLKPKEPKLVTSIKLFDSAKLKAHKEKWNNVLR